MKLVHPKEMTEEQHGAYKVCLAAAGFEVRKEELISSLEKGPHQLEEGLKLLDRKFPVPKCGICDLLACDVSSNAVAITVCQTLDIYGVAAALGRAEWMLENWDTVAHFYSALKNKNVRVVVLAGRVDDGARPLISRMREFEIFLYNGVSLAEDAWVVVQKMEPAFSSVHVREREEPLKVKDLIQSESPDALVEDKDYRSILTEEEIGEFFDKPAESFDGEDEVTNRISHR